MFDSFGVVVVFPGLRNFCEAAFVLKCPERDETLILHTQLFLDGVACYSFPNHMLLLL